jgi:hypothetical protein
LYVPYDPEEFHEQCDLRKWTPITKVRVARHSEEFSITRRLSRADELFKLDTLLEGGLYMARLDRFNDPREGTLGRKTKSLLDKAPAYVKRYIIRQI